MPAASDRIPLTAADVEAEGLTDWRPLFAELRARFATGDFATGLRLVARIGELAEAADHHPDVELTYPAVEVTLSSHDVGGLTARDTRLAKEISDVAAELSVSAEPQHLATLELALDTPDAAGISGFWAAVLAYDEGDGELIDPRGHGPTLWFQTSEPTDRPAQRFHLDLRLPPELVQTRLAAAVDAGGTLVDDESAPAFWVLADAQGNQVCLTTWQGRDEG